MFGMSWYCPRLSSYRVELWQSGLNKLLRVTLAKGEVVMVPVVAVALWRSDGAGGGQVLMQRRAAAREHGGLREFPGGKVEAEERAAAAAVREMAEELGVTIALEALEPVGFAEQGPEQGRGIVILLYRCLAWIGEPSALDAEAIAWVPVAGIEALAMPPLDYPLARALLHHAR